MDKVRCNKWKNCTNKKCHWKDFNENYSNYKLPYSFYCFMGGGTVILDKVSTLKKTFKAWSISDVIDGERQYIDGLYKDMFKRDDRETARTWLRTFKKTGICSPEARVEKVKITVEAE
jgi:hypothetical protein